MSHPPSCQAKNRRLIPQKLRHFFSTFPDAYEFPALPDWLLRQPMGSVWCVPKSPTCTSAGHRSAGGSRNRVQPESPHVAAAKRRHLAKKPSKVANLTYKNTWSSFLKTSQADHVKYLPASSQTWTANPRASKDHVERRPSVHFHRRSWDDSATASASSHPLMADCLSSRKPRSSSPMRRFTSRPPSMRTDSRKYLKIESKALREAWLNEDIFPHFGSTFGGSILNLSHSTPPPTPYVRRRPSPQVQRRIYRRAESIEANVSSGTTDSSFLTPGSMEMSGTSTLATTSGSLNVNATSSPTTSFDSMLARSDTDGSRLGLEGRNSSPEGQIVLPNDSLETTTTSQSVEVQVSSTLTNNSSESSTSMQPHLSSGSSGNNPILLVNSLPSSAMAREVLKRDRILMSSANRNRKSCLKDKFLTQRSGFKDPNRLEWTRRYLYTLSPRDTSAYYPDRSSSMSRVSSSFGDLQVYTVQQRPWQSSPDLRLHKWKSKFPLSSSVDDSFDMVDVLKKKKQFLSNLLQERSAEEDSYRSLKKEMRSLALIRTSSLPRCLSAGRSRSSEKNLSIAGSEPLEIKWKKENHKPRPDYRKSQELISRELEFRKQQNITTTARPFRFSTENLSRSKEKLSVVDRQRSDDDEKGTSFSTPPTPPTPRKKMPNRASVSPERRRARSAVKIPPPQSYSAPLQPASGENKASALRKSLHRKKYEDAQAQNWLEQQRERQRRNRLRALRLDPAWTQVRGGDQALEDIEYRRCFKEVVERERLLRYHMDREEMMNRVWQMPPLFERQKTRIEQTISTFKREVHQATLDDSCQQEKVADRRGTKSAAVRKKTSFKDTSSGNIDCYLADDSLQLSRPSTAKSSTKSSKRF